MNPALKQLGMGPNDRAVIIHADDIGMCHATLSGLAEMMDFGILSSAATMVPCPWFTAAAAFCRDHPNVDMGVHLTLNCEWESYKWGPCSTRDPATGLVDEYGAFHQWPAATIEHADPAAVAIEIAAQVRAALAAGIDATHLDTHMGTVGHPRFLKAYLDATYEHRLPPFASKIIVEYMRAGGAPEAEVTTYANLMQELEDRGIPLFDEIAVLPLDDPADQVGVAKRIIDGLKPGLSLLISHPAQDTPELRAIAPDWQSRVANYEVALSAELRDHIRASGVQVIGYRPLRDLIRANA